MTTNMTARDKKLLYILGFIVIIFLFILIADRPLFRKIRATNEEIAKEQATHDTIEMKLKRMDMVEEYRDAIQQKVDLYAKRYYPMMDSTRIDDLLTGYVLDHGLKAVNLYIDMPKEPILQKPYTYSEEAKKQEEAEQAGEQETGEAQVEAFTAGLSGDEKVDFEESSDQVSDTTLSGVYAAGVTLTAYGNETKLKAMLDQLFADQSLRVTGYTWGNIAGSGLSYVDGQIVELSETDRQLDVTLQVLMYDENAYVETAPESGQDGEE